MSAYRNGCAGTGPVGSAGQQGVLLPELPSPETVLAHVDCVLGASNSESAWAATVAAMQAFGFCHVVYGRAPAPLGVVPVTMDDFHMLSTLPREEMLILMTRRFDLNSVSVAWALRNAGLASWSMPPEDLPDDSAARQTPESLAYYEQIGFRAGCSIGFADGTAQGWAVMALASPPCIEQAHLDSLLPALQAPLLTLARVAHLTLSRFPWKRPAGSLTRRQREVLQWVGEGKTTADIACIMDLTPATVEKHLRGARQCLKVETTAHALIKASYLNQLYLRDP